MSDLGTGSRTLLEGSLIRVYAPNKVPDSPEYPYLEVSAGEFLPLAYSLDNSHGLREYQLVLRAFGRTEDSVIEFMGTALDLLLDKYVGAYGPGQIELRPQAPTRDPDDNGVLGAIATLTFTKEQ